MIPEYFHVTKKDNKKRKELKGKFGYGERVEGKKISWVKKKAKTFFTYMAWYEKTIYLGLSFSFLNIISVFCFTLSHCRNTILKYLERNQNNRKLINYFKAN